MASEVSSSLCVDESDSISVASTSTASIASDVSLSINQHTRPPYEHEPKLRLHQAGTKKLIYCKYCSWSGSVTTNVRAHLKAKHDIHLQATLGRTKQVASNQLVDLYKEAALRNTTQKIDIQVQRNILNKKVIQKALANLIVVRNLPFRVVEWPEFHTFCQALNSESIPVITSAHSNINSYIDQSWISQKDLVRKYVQSAITKIHLSVDIWTSPNRYLFLAICAYFVSIEEKRIRVLLALRTVVNHSADEQWNTLYPVLEEYGIIEKLGAVIADNAISNDKLCRTISDELLQRANITWHSDWYRIRCQGHIINLAVQAFLFQDIFTSQQLLSYDEVEFESELKDVQDQISHDQKFRKMGPLGKLHNIIVHSRASAGRTKKIKDLAQRTIPLDNRTRWNSWYDMLVVANLKNAAIDSYVKEYYDELGHDYLSPQDWQKLRTIQEFLEPFKRATLELQGHRASIEHVLFAMDILLKHLEESIVRHKKNREFVARIQRAWEKFTDYYQKTDNSPLYAAALILSPSRRTKYIYRNWKKEWQEPAISAVRSFWQQYKEQLIHSSPIKSQTRADLNLSMWDRIAQDLGHPRPQSQDEFEDYILEPPYEVSESALEWWCQDAQRKRWPKLSTMALNILSIPAMSDEPERVFSLARRTISWDRSQLSSETIEKVECLKSWHQGINFKLEGIE